MASLNGVNTNAEPAKHVGDFEPIPKGWQKVVIESEEEKTGQKTNVPYLVFKVKVIEGQYKNRNIWPMLHLWNESTFVDKKTGETKSVKEIAESELAAIKEACGKQVINDTRQLHMIPVEAFLIVEDDPKYGSKNVIKGWRAIKGNPPSVGGNLNRTTPPTSGTGSAQSGAYVPPVGTDGKPAYEDDIPAF